MVVAAYAVCAVIWGTTWYAIRLCIGPDGYPTFAAAALRFTLAALLLGVIVAAGFARPIVRDRRQLLWIWLAGCFNAVSFCLVYEAEEEISGGLAAVLYGTSPLFTALLAGLTRTERIARGAIVGALVALAGIALLFWDRLGVDTAQAVGLLLVLGSVAASTCYAVILKRHGDGAHPFGSTLVFLSSTAVGLTLATLLFEREPLPWPPPATATWALLYLGVVGSVLVFGTYLYLVKHVRLMTASTLVFVFPLIALGIDAMFESEVILGPRAWLGAAITLVGIALVVRERPRPASK